MRAREPESFWRENVIAIVTLLQAETSYKFCHFAIWRVINLLQ